MIGSIVVVVVGSVVVVVGSAVVGGAVVGATIVGASVEVVVAGTGIASGVDVEHPAARTSIVMGTRQRTDEG